MPAIGSTLPLALPVHASQATASSQPRERWCICQQCMNAFRTGWYDFSEPRHLAPCFIWKTGFKLVVHKPPLLHGGKRCLLLSSMNLISLIFFNSEANGTSGFSEEDMDTEIEIDEVRYLATVILGGQGRIGQIRGWLWEERVTCSWLSLNVVGLFSIDDGLSTHENPDRGLQIRFDVLLKEPLHFANSNIFRTGRRNRGVKRKRTEK